MGRKDLAQVSPTEFVLTINTWWKAEEEEEEEKEEEEEEEKKNEGRRRKKNQEEGREEQGWGEWERWIEKEGAEDEEYHIKI